MGSVLDKLLLAYRKEQDEKYAQTKSRQGREVDGRRRKDAEGSAAQAGGETPSGGPPKKQMRLVLKAKSPGLSPAAASAANPFAAPQAPGSPEDPFAAPQAASSPEEFDL